MRTSGTAMRMGTRSSGPRSAAARMSGRPPTIFGVAPHDAAADLTGTKSTAGATVAGVSLATAEAAVLESTTTVSIA